MKNIAIIFFFFLLFSCGNSPQSDHRYEGKKTEEMIVQNASEIKKLNLFLSLNWLQGPYGDPALESQFLMIVKNSKGEAVDLPENFWLKVTGIMPSMGHGTDWDGENSRIEKGLYFHKDLYFNMPGDWVLYVDLMKNDEVLETLSFTYIL